jgi:PAS domain S-box-containing protein
MNGRDNSDDQNDGDDAYLVPSSGNNVDYANVLQRQRAEACLRQNAALYSDEITNLSEVDIRHLLHELRVHQIELEMQNDELRESQIALDAARERYFELYDLAPIGYCVVNEQGLIWQANLTAGNLFGIARNVLLNQAFTRRIFREDQDVYYRHRKRIMDDGESRTFELRMLKGDGMQFWGDVTMTIADNAEGQSELRMMLSDISERKQADAEREQIKKMLLDKNAELEQAVARQFSTSVGSDNRNHPKPEQETP